MALYRDNPSRNPWRTDLFERLWRNRRAGLWGRPDLIHQVLHGEYADRGEDGMEVLCFEQADQLIEANGLVVDKDSRRTWDCPVSVVLAHFAWMAVERLGPMMV